LTIKKIVVLNKFYTLAKRVIGDTPKVLKFHGYRVQKRDLWNTMLKTRKVRTV